MCKREEGEEEEEEKEEVVVTEWCVFEANGYLLPVATHTEHLGGRAGGGGARVF